MWCCWPAPQAKNGPLDSATKLALTPFICTVPILFCTIVAVYNWSLEVPHACIDDDRYDMATECDAAGQLKPKSDLSD